MELSALLEEKSERATMWCRQDPEAEPGCPPAFQASAGLATAALCLVPQVFMQHGLPRHLLGIMSALHLKSHERQRPAVSSCRC